MQIRAVLFDFGGTLFSYRPLRARFDQLLVETAGDHGVHAPAAELRRRYAAATVAVLRDFEARSFYLHRELFGESGAAFVRSLGAEPRPDVRDRFYAGHTDVAAPLVQPRPGAAETLGALRELGLHVGIVSNIDDDQFAVLWERCGLSALADAITTSEQAGSCKPDAAIFRVALGKAGDPEPDSVVFVGDSPRHDVAGANALGMKTVLIADQTPAPEWTAPPGHAPDHQIAELRALLEIVGG